MKSRDALRVLSEVTQSQWGLVTSRQARALGVSHMNLTRLTEAGDLIRLTHGVYRDAGAPGDEHEELRAAWLVSEPAKLAYERLDESPADVVVSGESAARLHGLGDLRAMRSEFTTPVRKQTQRSDVHYRTRRLSSVDVTVREGLPVTTIERTIADLVEDRNDLTIVASVLGDAVRRSRLDVDRLVELLRPLADRNGYGKDNGEAFLADLQRLAGLDRESLATKLADDPALGALVAVKYLEGLPKVDVTPIIRVFVESARQLGVAGLQEQVGLLAGAVRVIADAATLEAGRVTEALAAIDWSSALGTSGSRQELEAKR